MDKQKFTLALQGEGMDPDHADIIARELYAIYAHTVLGGVYNPVDYGDSDTLKLKAHLRVEHARAINNCMRAMLKNDSADEAKLQARQKEIEAEQRARGLRT